MKFLMSLLLTAAIFGCRGGDLSFSVRFHNLSSLTAGDRVLLAGREVGQVDSITQVDDGTWWVAVTVQAPFREQITTGSRFTIESDPEAPGRKSIQISPDPKGLPIKDGTVVEGTDPLLDFMQPLLKGLGEGVGNLQQQLKALNRELETLPESPEFHSLQRRLEELARQMREAEKTMRQDLLPPLQKEIERLRREMEKAQPEKEKSKPQVDSIDL